jgi:hydrogenase nickel incorporation protein HypA/HybF
MPVPQPAMHELAVCQALLTQVQRVADQTRAGPVRRIVLKVGPLSGVEPQLLRRAFDVARLGGIAAESELSIEPAPVRVRCLECDAETDATANRLLCARCGAWHTQLLSGEELVLQRLEFAPAAAAA